MMTTHSDFTPELRGDVVFLSDQAINVLIKAGLRSDVVHTAKRGWVVRDCDTQEMQAIIADTLLEISNKHGESPSLDD